MLRIMKYTYLPALCLLSFVLFYESSLKNSIMNNRQPSSISINSCNEILKSLMSVNTQFDDARFRLLYADLGKGYILEELRSAKVKISNKKELISSIKANTLKQEDKKLIWDNILFKRSSEFESYEAQLLSKNNHHLINLLRNSSTTEDINRVKDIITEIKHSSPNLTDEDIVSEIIQRLKTCKV